jgi:ABC-type Mn2+/Zn2+ transport system ATPase subunit
MTAPVTQVPPQDTTPASAPVTVRLSHVSAGYDHRPALDEVSFEIGAGSLVAIFGPNGGGKTTVLKLIAGLMQPWSGSIEVFGSAPGHEAHRVAYVPQAELVDWSFPVSVWDVVMMGRFPRLGIWRRPDDADRLAVTEAIERVGMADRRSSQIGALSGGQRRRAFLARAIAADPDLYLLDEPVTGVDVTTQEDLMALLAAETRDGRTAIATTHDLAAAAEHFTTVVGLNRRLIAIGPSELVLDPEVLSATYGGHLLVLGNRAVVLDDAHHHDAASGHEPHFHEGEKGR